MTGDPKLDGKFEVLRELERNESRRVVEARHEGHMVRLDWFNVSNPKMRSDFHRYRTALKNTASPLMLDAVARPGAYYTVWQITAAPTAEHWLKSHPRDQAFRAALEVLAVQLAEHGFALSDAQIIALSSDGRETQPALLDLKLVARTADEIMAINKALVLGFNNVPKVKRWSFLKRSKSLKTTTASVASTVPPQVVRKITFWGVIPGIVFLTLAGYLGTAATQTFLDPPVVTVPNVVGKSLTDAAGILARVRLTARFAQGDDQTKLRGVILRQNPISGTTLTESRVVEITVNAPRPLEVPDLSGKTRGDALFALRERGLDVGRFAIVATKTGEARGVILGQFPSTGTDVPKGTKITLLISGDPTPPGETFIPDLAGLKFDDAKFILERSGLSLVEVRQDVTTRRDPGIVTNQTPAANTLVALNGEATLTITKAPRAALPVIPSPPPPPAQIISRPAPSVSTPDISPSVPAGQSNTPQPTPSAPERTTPLPTSPAVPDNVITQPEPLVGPPPPTNITPDPATPPVATPANPESRRVSFTYSIPLSYGAVVAEVRVTDINGERVLLGPAQSVGGSILSGEFEVRGSATFVVFADGVSIHIESR